MKIDFYIDWLWIYIWVGFGVLGFIFACVRISIEEGPEGFRKSRSGPVFLSDAIIVLLGPISFFLITISLFSVLLGTKGTNEYQEKDKP